MIRIAHRCELLKRLPRGSECAELGVLDGLFSAEIVAHTAPRRLHLVDRWDSPFTIHRQDGTGWQPVTLTGPEAKAAAARRVASAIASGRVELHRLDTVAWLRKRPPASLDWIYLDSNHSFEHVAAELWECRHVVRPGGWICGHDYCSVFPGVVHAVDEFCRRHGRAITILTSEPELPVFGGLPWMPSRAAFNSFAIRWS
jgi:hypothetical protein